MLLEEKLYKLMVGVLHSICKRKVFIVGLRDQSEETAVQSRQRKKESEHGQKIGPGPRRSWSRAEK